MADRQEVRGGAGSTAAGRRPPAVRMTRQKQALAALLRGTEEFTSAQELHARLRASGEGVGLTTVYAQLKALAEAGEIDSVRGEGGEALYRRCESGSHHHHLVCRRCGQAVEVAAPDIEAWAREIAAAHGYSDPEHVVEVTGLCARCRALGAAEVEERLSRPT